MKTGAISRGAIAGLALGSSLAAAILAPAVTAEPDHVKDCGGAENKVQDVFELASGAELWQVYPAMGMAPDIAEASDPITVVAFDNPYSLDGMVAVDSPPTVQDVVCVVTADGIESLFTQVSKAGALLP
jgi:hypothetical protein